MKFRCDSKQLTEAIQTAIRVMAVRTPMEILEGILLDADEYGLTVTASDGNMSTVCRIDAEIETDGMVLLPGRLISEIIRKLPYGTIEASLSNRFVLTIRCQGSRFNVAGRNGEEFPIPEDRGLGECISLPQPMLKEMIHLTSFAVPLEDQRVILTGGFLNMQNGDIDMVGLDGFRMAVKSARVSDLDSAAKAIIPKKALDEIEKLMGDDENEMTRLRFGPGRLMIESGSTRFFTSLIEGEYIDYHRVIPRDFKLFATVNTADFASCVERAALIARSSRNNLIKLEISENLVVLSATSETGDVREELLANTEGDELTISFNVKYLSEMARVITGERVILKFGTSVTPCVITPEDGNDFTCLILPVRTNA